LKKTFILTGVLLVTTFIITMFFIGCGGDNQVNTLPVIPTPTVAGEVPLHDPPLGMVSSESGGLASGFIDLITEGLKDGVKSWIGDNTTGRVLDLIGNALGFNTEQQELEQINEQLKEMNSKMDQVLSQLTVIEQQLTALQHQLLITQVNLESYISNTVLGTYITNISSKFDTTSPSGFMYFSQQGSKLDPNTDPNSPEVITLKKEIATYATYNFGVLETQIQGIHDAICPSTTALDGVLKQFVDKIILQNPTSAMTDPNNAMANYLLLENYFAQILNYQTKALIIVTEINNYKDPSGTAASSYLNGTYKKLLTDEILAFHNTVQYMMLNMYDYRTTANYANECSYTQGAGIIGAGGTGLAKDNIFLMVYARSRFFTAQVRNAFENNFGLHGIIITPYNYAQDSDASSPRTITLNLSQNNVTQASVSVQAKKMAGRFPYTQWQRNPYLTVSPDNNWAIYEFDTTADPSNTTQAFNANLPAGTYNVSISGQPWYNTSSNLGTVTILYYDPNNPDYKTATTNQTATNTVKFGCFSGRWNWGHMLLRLIPGGAWYPQMLDADENMSGYTYFPTKDNPDIMNNMWFNYPVTKNAGTTHEQKLMFETLYQFSTTDISSLFYDHSTYLYFHTSDGGAKQKNVYCRCYIVTGAYPNGITNYMSNESYDQIDTQVSNVFSGMTPTMSAGSKQVTMSQGTIIQASSNNHSTANVSVQFSFHPVFMNTYNIFQ